MKAMLWMLMAALTSRFHGLDRFPLLLLEEVEVVVPLLLLLLLLLLHDVLHASAHGHRRRICRAALVCGWSALVPWSWLETLR